MSLMERHSTVATGAGRGFAGVGSALFESADPRLADLELASDGSRFATSVDGGKNPLAEIGRDGFHDSSS
jgi:hypothetical protein